MLPIHFRRLPGRLIGAVVIGTLGVCTASAQPTDTPRAFTVLLDWFVNPDHAPLVIAQERGYFAAERLEVTLIEPSDPSAPPRLVAAGQGDAAISYQPNLHQQIDEGLPLINFGTLVETPLNTVIVDAAGPIDSLADLEGGTVGFSVSGFEDAILNAMLRNAGVDPASVELVNVNFALAPALLSGRVDAIIGGFRNFEMTQIELAGGKGLVFFPEEHGVPAYDELIYVAHRDRANDPRLAAFLRAVEAATLYLTNHPEDALAIFLNAYPNLDDTLNRRAFVDTLPRFAKRPAALDPARYARFGAFLAQAGLIGPPPPAKTYLAAPRD